jgi:hypothetical protein
MLCEPLPSHHCHFHNITTQLTGYNLQPCQILSQGMQSGSGQHILPQDGHYVAVFLAGNGNGMAPSPPGRRGL